MVEGLIYMFAMTAIGVGVILVIYGFLWLVSLVSSLFDKRS